MWKMTKHILLVSITLVFLITLFEYSNIDIWLQDTVYNFESSKWILDRDDKLSKLIFYDGIKKVIIAFILMVFFSTLLFRKSQFVQNYKEGISIVLLSAILVPLTVGALKATTNIPCPSNLEHYGGTYPHITLSTPYPQDFYQAENIRCYPAGHASGGFALLSLVFLFKNKRNKLIAAVSALAIGWSMGIYKMLIGDHFLSHTFVTMMLAWLIILIIAKSVRKVTDKYKKPLVLR